MIRLLLFLTLLLCPHPLKAAALDMDAFAQLPVQHDGRIKPLDTFARALLVDISGHTRLDGMSAEDWLAETLFDPAQALQRPIFRIFRPEVLGLPARESKYYSFAELAPALQQRAQVIETLSATPDKEWSEDQRELMRLSDTATLYVQLLRSFSFVLPLNITVPPALAKEWKVAEERPFTLQDYRRFEPRLKERIKTIIRKKGEDPANYTDEERDIARLGMNLQILEQAGQGNVLLRIIPGVSGEEWFSPWAITQAGEGSPEGAAYLDLWKEIAHAYQDQNFTAWDESATKALAQAHNFKGTEKLALETRYNQTRPLLLAGLSYLGAFLVVIVYMLRGNGAARTLSLGLMSFGAALHLGAIAVRVIILDRPPVGTLYESILFVTLVCVLVSLVLEFLRKDGQALLIGSIGALLLLFTAGSFADGDTMKMLVAVLNTNFWLSTHVLCITMGYGWCVMASLLAHAWLVRKAFGRDTAGLAAAAKIIGVIALLFTAVGTILGGIWADQSWGRFWGWDPKENGALLIVLWLAWVFHGQIGARLKLPAFMAGLAATSVIVAVAWFGVNLLSVGLHSYGFISGVAAGLAAFCAVELSLIGFLWLRIRQRSAA